MRKELKKFKGFTMKNMPEYEGFAPGHRACQGCGTVLPLRLALKALGPDTIVVNATGCMEIISTPFSTNFLARGSKPVLSQQLRMALLI